MRKVLLAALVLTLMAIAAPAQEITGTIYGTVTTADGLAITSVKVTLRSEHTAPMSWLTSDRGTFYFGKLPVGPYSVTFEKPGYQKVVREDVNVRLNDNIRLEVAMSPSEIEEVITISGETPLVDLKKTGTKTAVTQEILSSIPTARDPWVILDQVPGVTMDRVNVGGSESGQQSNYMVSGSSWNQSSWNVDGVTITDSSALGSSPMYYDFDAFEEMQITTGGADASVQTGGASLNFITKQGSDTYHGQFSYYVTDSRYQSTNIPDELRQTNPRYTGNRIDAIKDYGFDIGGPLFKGRAWFWGAYRVQDIGLLAITGATDLTKLENYNLKISAQPDMRNRVNFVYTRGDKIKKGRGAAWNVPPEATFDQNGPSPLYKIEDIFMATDTLILSGKYTVVFGGFMFEPRGGRDTPCTYDLNTTMYGGSTYYYVTDRPTYGFNLNAEKYIDQAFGGSHEFKAGYEYRLSVVSTIQNYGGGMFQYRRDGVPERVNIYAERNEPKDTKRHSFFLQDTFSMDRLTLNLGLRYDKQGGQNRAADGPASLYNLIPAISFPGGEREFSWSDIVPRLGFTYDLSGTGKFILRGNFAMYADQLGTGTIAATNTMILRRASYYWTDTNGDFYPQPNELGTMYSRNFNPDDPFRSAYSFDPNLSAPRSYEIMLGAERELMTNLSGMVGFTYRKYTNFFWYPENGFSSSDFSVAGVASQGGFSTPYYDSTKARTFTYTGTQRPDYSRKFWGLQFVVTKRFADRWMANVSLAFNNITEHYDSPASYIDPTGVERVNGMYWAPETGASGKTSVWVGSKWVFKLTGLYQLPFGINVSGFLNVRQGYIYPSYVRSATNRTYGGTQVEVLGEDFGTARLPTFAMLDGRVEKEMAVQDWGRLGLVMDIFNVFNSNTVLGKVTEAYLTNYGNIMEIVNPRIIRFGIRLRF